jgi:hypothetical protein
MRNLQAKRGIPDALQARTTSPVPQGAALTVHCWEPAGTAPVVAANSLGCQEPKVEQGSVFEGEVMAPGLMGRLEESSPEVLAAHWAGSKTNQGWPAWAKASCLSTE